MLGKIILSCLFFVSLVGCHPKNGTDRTDKTGHSDSRVICDTAINTNAAFSYKDDQFIANALSQELTCNYLDSIFRNIDRKIKISKNKYAEELSDTVVTYKTDCDTVAFLSTKENCFPLFLNIASARLSFNHGAIKVGMEKEQFLDRFHIKKATPDVIKITETESANELIFVFQAKKLSRIIYNNLYVD